MARLKKYNNGGLSNRSASGMSFSDLAQLVKSQKASRDQEAAFRKMMSPLLSGDNKKFNSIYVAASSKSAKELQAMLNSATPKVETKASKDPKAGRKISYPRMTGPKA